MNSSLSCITACNCCERTSVEVLGEEGDARLYVKCSLKKQRGVLSPVQFVEQGMCAHSGAEHLQQTAGVGHWWSDRRPARSNHFVPLH